MSHDTRPFRPSVREGHNELEPREVLSGFTVLGMYHAPAVPVARAVAPWQGFSTAISPFLPTNRVLPFPNNPTITIFGAPVQSRASHSPTAISPFLPTDRVLPFPNNPTITIFGAPVQSRISHSPAAISHFLPTDRVLPFPNNPTITIFGAPGP